MQFLPRLVAQTLAEAGDPVYYDRAVAAGRHGVPLVDQDRRAAALPARDSPGRGRTGPSVQCAPGTARETSGRFSSFACVAVDA